MLRVWKQGPIQSDGTYKLIPPEDTILEQVREAVQDFNFRPEEYQGLLDKYGCQAGGLYPTIQKHLARLVGAVPVTSARRCHGPEHSE